VIPEIAPTAQNTSTERKTLRVFVSSPDDLGEERALVQDLIKRLAVEYQRHFALEAVIWEETALSAAQDFQQGIVDPSKCDIVVVMLWSKLGSIIQAPGYEGMTGTEWEFHDAIRRAEIEGKPVVLMYRKTAPKSGDLMDPAVVEQAREDRNKLEAFFSAEVVGKKRAFRAFDNKDRLAQMLEHHLRSELNKYRASESEGFWEGSPFRGLKSFEYEHRSIYFGRDQARRQLLHQLAQQVEAGAAFIMVTAMSGSGKSSLVKAGLLPLLESYKAIGDVVMTPWSVMRPNDASSDPVVALADALLRPKGMAAAATSEDISTEWVAEALRRSPGLLQPFIQTALGSMAEGGDARLVLVVDQFEELFSNKHFSEQSRRQFIDAIDSLARSGLVWVIGTIRSDFMHEVEAWPTLVTLMRGDGQYHLARPREDELLQMIREPARIAGLKFEQGPSSGLDHQLMADAAKDLGSLPLLEFTLDALYERRDGSTFTFAAYEALGGIEGAVADRAERVFSTLPADAQASFERVFRMLVTVDPETRGVSSRRARRDQLEDSTGAQQLIEAFVGGHLLVSDLGPEGESVVWVAHEALLRVWPRLSRWVDDNIADLRARGHLSERASQWDRERRNDDFLLAEGRPYAEAVDLVQRFGDQLEPLERLYVQRSAQRIRSNRWRLVGLLSFLAVLVGLVALATVAFSNAARNLQAGNLEKAASELDRGNIARSVFLSVNSDLLPDRATGVLSRAFSREYLHAMVNQRDEQGDDALIEAGYQAGFSADGNWVITISGHDGASLWALENDTPSYAGPVPVSAVSDDQTGQPLVAALFSDDGQRLALIADRCLRVLGTEQLPAVMAGKRALLPAAGGCDAASAGGMLALAIEDGTVARDLDGIRLARWSGDGRWLVLVQTLPQSGQGEASGQRLLVFKTGSDALSQTAAVDLPGEVRGLALSGDGGRFALATRGGSLCVGRSSDGSVDCQKITRKRPVNQLVFDQSGNRLAAVSADQMVRLFDVRKSKPRCIGVLGSRNSGKPGGKGSWYAPGQPQDCRKAKLGAMVHDGSIRAVAFSPDGSQLATGGDDRRVVVWNLGEGRVRPQILGSHEQTVNGALFAPESLPNRLVTSSIDHTARLWDSRTGEQLMVFGHDGPVTQARFTHGSSQGDANGLMTVAGDRTARLWRIVPTKPIAYPLQGHQNHVWHVGFRPPHGTSEQHGDDRAGQTVQVVTTSYDGYARLWNLRIADSGSDVQQFRYLRERIEADQVTEFPAGVSESGTDPVRYAAFANTAERLLTTTKQGRVGVWALDGEALCSLALGGQGSPAALLPLAGFSPDDQRLFSAQTGKGAQRWDLGRCGEQRELICEPPACQPFQFEGAVSAADSQVDGAAGRWSLAVGLEDGRIAVLDADNPATPICQSKDVHAAAVVQLGFSPDRSSLVSASTDGTATLWDAKDCSPLQVYKGGHDQSLYSARFDPDGKRIVTASQDRTAILWDLDGTLLKRLVGHLDRVYHASFSPDGRWILTASRDGTARLWDSEADGPVLSTVVELEGNGSGISSAGFSPDGRFVATGYWEPGADLWDVLTGTPHQTMELTIPDYARRFVELNRLGQWKVQSVPAELPWWQEIGTAIWRGNQ